LIAYIEQDHFIAVTAVNNHGVTYICSDCGAWPGGEVTLNWKQWHTLEPSLYASVQKPGTQNDQLFATLEAGKIPPVAKVATAGLGHGIIPSSREWINVAHGLQPHLIFGFPNGHVKCGTKVAALHCTGYQSCPMVCIGRDPVNVSNGEEEYAPPADLIVYNPNGPSVKWGRIYNSLRGSDSEYQSTDFGVGWSQSYNIGVFAPAVSQPEGDVVVHATRISGTTGPLPAVGSEAPIAAATWDVFQVGGGVVGSSLLGNGWSVALAGSGTSATLNITVQGGITLPGYYRARYRGTTQNYSLGFYVYPDYNNLGSPSISMGYDIGTNGDANASLSASGQYYVNDFIVLPNGARIPFEVPTSSSVNYAHCNVAPGYPVDVQAYFGTIGGVHSLTGLVITFDDLTVWTTYFDTSTTRYSNSVNGGSFYSVQQISGRAGYPIALNYNNLGVSGFPQLTSIQDTHSPFTYLLTVTRDPSGWINQVSDCYGRSVYYNVQTQTGNSASWPELTHASQIVATGTASPPDRYAYGYAAQSNLDGSETVPFLTQITNPTLNSGGSPSTLTLAYDQSTDYVSSVTDSNGNVTSFASVYSIGGAVAPAGTPTNYTRVTTTGHGTTYTHTMSYDGLMNEIGDTDGSNSSNVVSSVFGDPSDPYRPSAVTDGNGKTWNMQWDGYGHLNGLTTPRGVHYTYTWGLNNISSIFTPNSQPWTLPLLTSVYEAGKSNATSYGYNQQGLLTGVNYPQPGVSGTASTKTLTYYRDAPMGNVTRIQQPWGTVGGTTVYNNVYFGYIRAGYTEMLGKPATVTDNNGKVWSYFYDSTNNNVVNQVTDPFSNSSYFGHDLAGALTYAAEPATGQTGSGANTTYYTRAYPGAAAYQVTAKDESGSQVRQVTRTYGSEDELLGQSGSADPFTATYDGLYRLATLTDGNSNVTSYFYNTAGYPYQTVYPGAQLTPPTLPLAAGSRDTRTFTLYDNAGNLKTAVDGKGQTTTYQYNDADDLLSNVTYPTSPTSVTLQRDTLGRVKEVDDGNSNVLKYTYDDNDTVTSTSTQYASWPTAKTVSYGYNWDGTRASMTVPSGTYNYGYDIDRRLNAMTDPEGVSSSWLWDDAGRLSTETLGSGVVRTYGYLPNNMVSSLTNHNVGTGAVLADFSNLQYDGAGNLLSMSSNVPSVFPNSTLTPSYTYDSRNRLTQEKYQCATPSSANFVTSPTYVEATDATLGNFGASNFTVSLWVKTTSAASIQYLIGKRATSSYGSFFDLSISAGKEAVDVCQDPAGTNYYVLNGTKTVNDGLWHSIIFTRTGATLALYVDGTLDVSHTSSGTVSISNTEPLRMGYLKVSSSYPFTGQMDEVRLYSYALSTTQISHLASTGGAAINPPASCLVYWNFDALSGGTILDMSGKGQTATMSPSLSTTSSTPCPQSGFLNNFAYDGGFLTGVGNLTANGDASYSYNSDNQLSTLTYDGNGNPSTSSGVSLAYDSQDRVTSSGGSTIAYRADGTRASQSDNGGVYYLYDGPYPIEALSSSGGFRADYSYGPNGYMGGRTSSTVGTFLTYDPLGNAVQGTDYSGTLTVSQYPTGAFGVIAGTNLPTSFFGYQHNFNYVPNSATGLLGLGARNYDPRVGRFVNRDPISYGGGMNVYAYAGSNPVNGMDRTGLEEELPEPIEDEIGGDDEVPPTIMVPSRPGFPGRYPTSGGYGYPDQESEFDKALDKIHEGVLDDENAQAEAFDPAPADDETEMEGPSQRDNNAQKVWWKSMLNKYGLTRQQGNILEKGGLTSRYGYTDEQIEQAMEDLANSLKDRPDWRDARRKNNRARGGDDCDW